MKKTFLLGLIFFSCVLAKEPEILWWFDTNDSSFGQSAFDDIDNDGKNEIVFGCYRNDSCVYALNAEDGSLLWKYNTAQYQEGCNDVAALIYDVNNDKNLEVIVPSSCNPFTFCFDGANGNIIWKTATKGSDSPPTISDINNDGRPEILHGEFGGYVICLDAVKGNVNWEIAVDTNSWIQTAPTISDLNKDGYKDLVVATWNFNDNNKIFAYSGYDNSMIWSTEIDDYVYHGFAIIDLNNDGKNEIVFGDYSGVLYNIDAETGEINYTYQSDYYIGAPVTVADINLDGNYEILLSSGFYIIALDYSGNELWKYTIPDYGISFRGTIVSDILDDESLEVIFGTSKGDLIVLSGESGQLIHNIELKDHIGKEFNIDHAPLVGDFNNNGSLDVFIVGGYTNYPDFSGNYGRAYAIEFEKGTGPEWKMFQNNAFRNNLLEIEKTSVKKFDKNNKTFQIFQNLVQKGETIEFNQSFDNILIYELTGRLISKFENKDYLKTDDLQRGIYIISFIFQNNFQTEKLIVY